MMARAIGLVALLSVSGCAAYEARMDCRRTVGEDPGAAWGLFGAVGGLVRVSQDDWQAWNRRMSECVSAHG